MRQVARLKAQAKYSQKLPFEDEESATYPASHNFYFHSAEDKLLFFLSVAPAKKARKATIALVSVMNLEGQDKGEWKRLNQETDPVTQQRALAWFNAFIRPQIKCK